MTWVLGDADKAERAKRHKARKRKADRDRAARNRAERGSVPRAEYLAQSLSATQPWKALGISRSTWERRRRAAATALTGRVATTIDKPTIAEEHFARLIAMWHGQKMICGSKTVAAMGGFDSGWAGELDRYVDARWPEYVSAARAVISARS